MAQFISFLQNNGFPTRLLDWSFSPYIAAYFAFEGVDHFNPKSDEVAIYSFDQKAWGEKFKQTLSYVEEASHVSLLRPTFRGNHKQMLQQGVFWFTNCQYPEEHVKAHEKEGHKYLTKYILSVKERVLAIRELELMGVTAMQLAPCVESVCKKTFESIATRIEVGPTSAEKEGQNYVGLFPPSSILDEAGKAKEDREYINCPACNAKFNPKNLKKHLKNQHDQ